MAVLRSVLAALMVAVALAGCAMSSASHRASGPLIAADPEPAVIHPFGATVATPDGISISVAEPREVQQGPNDFLPDFPAMKTYGHYVEFTITVANNSEIPVNASGVNPTVVSAERWAERLVDWGGTEWPDGMVHPGAPESFPIVYAVIDPDDVQIEVLLPVTDERDFRVTFASQATLTKQIRPEPAAPDGADEAPWGTYLRWSNGLAITVTAPQDFVPDEVAAALGEKGSRYVKSTVRAINTSDVPLTAASMDVTAFAGNEVLDEFVDLQNGLGIQPGLLIAPGGAEQFDVAYVVETVDDFFVEICPAQDASVGLFTP